MEGFIVLTIAAFIQDKNTPFTFNKYYDLHWRVLSADIANGKPFYLFRPMSWPRFVKVITSPEALSP